MEVTMDIVKSNDRDDITIKRISSCRKRNKAKTYDNEFMDNEEQLMLNQVCIYKQKDKLLWLHYNINKIYQNIKIC